MPPTLSIHVRCEKREGSQPAERKASRHVALLSSLTRLDIGYNIYITDKGLQHLAEIRSLRKVNIAGCRYFTKAGIKCLQLPQRQMELLLRWNCDWTLDYLAGIGDVEAMEQMLEFGKLPEMRRGPWRSPDCTPFYTACAKGKLGAAKLLAHFGADVLRATRRGESPLSAACKAGHTDIVELLIRLDLDVNVQSKDAASRDIYGELVYIRSTPLSTACRAGRFDVAALLLSHGADVRIPDDDGRTPLHEACQWGNTATVSNLIRCGADVNARSNDGATPLSVASRNAHTETVRMLVSCGASANASENEVLR